MPSSKSDLVWKALACASGALFIAAGSAFAGPPKILHSFCAKTSCADGELPLGNLLRGDDGTIYGTTLQGGAHGAGVAFALVPNGTGLTFNVLHSFCKQINCTDGSSPVTTLIIDGSGNLYGTASAGGAHSNGMVFELKPNADRSIYTFADLYDFCAQSNCADGSQVGAGLTYAGAQTGVPYDGTSPLFGTAQRGGGSNAGIAFRLTFVAGQQQRNLDVLYNFCSRIGCPDGGGPSGLIVDDKGNLYGAANFGGNGNGGTLFRLNASNNFNEKVLYAFCSKANCSDGKTPLATPSRNSKGAFFGTTNGGGDNGQGTVYKVAADGTETVLYSFCAVAGCPDGAEPQASVVLADHGNIFGSTPLGGANTFAGGTIFKIAGGTFSTIYSFCGQANCTDGNQPGGMILGGRNVLYGITGNGGTHDPAAGTVFRLKIVN